MIREATYKDLFDIRDLLLEVQDEVGYGHVTIHEMVGMKALNHLISSKRGLVLVSYDEGKLIGVLAASAIDYWCSERDYYVTDLLFICKDPIVSNAMINAVEKWAESLRINVVDITLGISSGVKIDRTEDFYESKGYHRIGGSYMKVLHYVESRKVG